MNSIVLLGDSIFDNRVYVPGEPAVVDHLNRSLPAGSTATLLAVDGSIAASVEGQLKRLPSDATHLIVSAGGNDALGNCGLILNEVASSFRQVMTELATVRAEFEIEYRAMLENVLSLRKPTVVLTIYDAVPGLEACLRAALALFNDVILRQAAGYAIPVIDLRAICTEASDYAASSPIEPSNLGGAKIARTIARVVAEHDFSTRSCRVYT
jgi:hypothetical protein